MSNTEMTARVCHYADEIVHRHTDQESHDLHEMICAARHQIELDAVEREVYEAKAKRFMALHTQARCKVCSRKLRSASSIATGIGPECAAQVEAARAALEQERTQREQQAMDEAEEIQVLISRIETADLILSGVTPVPSEYRGSWEDADDYMARTWAERLELVSHLDDLGIELKA